MRNGLASGFHAQCVEEASEGARFRANGERMPAANASLMACFHSYVVFMAFVVPTIHKIYIVLLYNYYIDK